MHFFFFTFLFCYFVLKKTQFHHTKHSNFNSSHFYSQKSQTLHHFVLLFSKSQNSFSKIQKNTNLHKFTQNAHFTPISFPSPQFVYLSRVIFTHNTPSLSNTSSFTTKKSSKKSHKKLIFYKNSKLPFLTPHLT